MSHYSLSCRSSTFKHRSPEKKNCSGNSLRGQSRILWVRGEKRHMKVQLNTSMAWTKRPEVIGRVLVCSQFKDELRIPRWVKKESAGRGVHPSHPAGVLGSSRLSGACSQLSIALHCLSNSAEPGCHTLRERRTVQPCSALALTFFFRFSVSSFGVLYC